MNKLVFATNNQHKVDEIKAVIGNLFEVVSLKDAGIIIDIPEPFNTLEENADTKSETIFKITGSDCFSEDTGLEVDALNGLPGVKSARYAEEDQVFKSNIDKLLFNMQGKTNRQARFRTVISLILNGDRYQFEGICEGTITDKPDGMGGFGYDPVFVPNGSLITFANMSMTEKNIYSHRKKATTKLLNFLSRNGK